MVLSKLKVFKTKSCRIQSLIRKFPTSFDQINKQPFFEGGVLIKYTFTKILIQIQNQRWIVFFSPTPP
jgi:hypothetical protein